MFKNLSTKNKVLWFISISLMAFIVLLIINIYFSKKEDLLREENLLKKDTVTAYNNILHNYEIFYKSRLEGILNSPSVKEAIKNQDRLKLYSLVEKRWNILKKENSDVKIMHFHKPNGLTLLRMHNPKKYDDDIAKKRAMCAYMHKHKKAISSFEAGIHLLGYRVMVPIFYNNKYIGALEIGTKPNFVLNQMKNFYNVSGVIFAKQNEIFNKKLIDKTKKIISNYRLDSNSLEDQSLIDYLPKDYDLNKNTRIQKDGKTYDIYLLNHKDFKGEISAKTLIFNDVSIISEHFDEAILKITLFSLLLYIILIFTIKLGFEKILDKIDSTNKDLENSNKELEKSIAFLRSHQLAMDESSIVTKADLKGNMTYANENFYKITGLKEKETIGKPHSIVRHPDNPKEIFKDLWETIQSKRVWKGRIKNRSKKGDYWVDTAILPILDNNDEIVEYIAVRHDVTEIIKQQKKLDNAANTDSLTGLGSRYKLTQDIKCSINPAIAILNIDSFSQINDFYGHIKGDIVIRNLGILLNKLKNDGSYKLYHLQGDEFVIFNNNTQKDSFIDKVTQISSLVSTAPIIVDEDELFLSLSTAISFEDKNKLLTTADMALKIAKKENKNIVVYNDYISLDQEYQNNIKWAKKIKEAIEYDKFIPVFQPIVNNHNNDWEKYECLVRMEDDGKLISPYFFLEISKKTKYYTQITKIMLNKSFAIFKYRKEEFSVNLTIEDILNDEINGYIFEILEEYKIGSRVVFEIVESESIENFDEIKKFIERIKTYKCKVAIDDFGTGYSNFEYLLKLKADYIKIDGSMIKDIDTNTDAQLVVSTIVEFAKKMDMKTIAEFVENDSILSKVNELGIDYSQGYHFSEPKKEI